ncbi:histidine kinase-group i protein [Diplodia corticola]|uniref:Histidine kinase-group i protein n=1 Tax=Diplodia corticola TaxID=236234 RepID=A0A1J9S3H7_9PEZI|nr:histidine kinase-group i protein [Diplodia corticola]OJD34181.1 histidine kinase-group i protein [Diplodia corticola]
MSDASTTHEFRRYADALDPGTPQSPGAAHRALAIDPALAKASSLCEALDALVEVVAVRLNAFAAFITLTDGSTQHLLAGSWHDKHDSDDPNPPPTPQWFAPTPADRAAWLHLFRLTLGLNDDDDNENTPDHLNKPTPTPPITRRRLADAPHTAHLTCVTSAPHARRFAAAPIVSARGVPIGAVFTLHTRPRLLGGERNAQARLLHATAAKAMAQLEVARAVRSRDRLAALHGKLKAFVKFKDVVALMSEEPPVVVRRRRRDGQVGSELRREEVLREEDMAEGGMLKGSDEGEAGALGRNHDNVENAASVSVDDAGRSDGGNRGRGSTEGETMYRKVFARAAEGLRCGLDVEGVTFLNGLVGFHGLSNPVGEAEIELENEMDAQTVGEFQDNTGTEPGNEDAEGSQTLRGGSAASQSKQDPDDSDSGGERTFISTAYERSVLERRPAECLGLSVVHDKWPIVKHLGKGTVGLKFLDEGFLQRLLRRFPDGNVWYFGEDNTLYTFSLEDDRLISVADDDDLRHVSKSFPGVRQLFFAPLTDPTSLKRLACCLAWTTRITPLFTRAADLDPVRTFLQSVESEVSRIDAIAAVKQQEAFVSSVSHELRTPLHGILGAVEFLSDTSLDSFQCELAETIRSCSTTLHDTLSSVLAYAKINQFERRSDKPVARRRALKQPSPWAMEDKDLGRETADTEGTMYCVADVSTLCEGVVEVTANGYSFGNETSKDVAIVLNIAPRPRWTFVTEPAIIKRILSNILGNALKYTESGYVKVSVHIDDTENDPSDLAAPNDDGRKLLFITVADSGRGINKDFLQKHLFSPFTQENAVATDGVGLGMSIVKSMVGLLGGKIRVTSTPGKGTTFTVSIPMQENKDDVPTSEPSAALTEALLRVRERRRKVAIFGFDSMLRESLLTYFRDWFQWDVVESGEGERCWADIVVVDGTGDAATKAIRHGFDASVYLFVAALEKPARTKRRNSLAAGSQGHIEVTTTRPIGPLKLCKAVLVCLARLAEVDLGETVREADTAARDSRQPKRQVSFITTNNTEPEPASTPQPSSSAEEASSAPAPPSSLPMRPPTDLVPSPIPERPHRPSPPPHLAPPSAPPPGITNSSSSSSTVAAKPGVEGEESPRLLLVEDNAVNLKLLQTFLKKQGYTELTAAGNGQIAVNEVVTLGEGNRGFDVIFMDISMPVMDGFAATMAIRAFERERRDESEAAHPPLATIRPPTYIVALTGLAGTMDEERAYAAGVDLVLTKPVKFKELGGVLEKWQRGERVLGRFDEEKEKV